MVPELRYCADDRSRGLIEMSRGAAERAVVASLEDCGRQMHRRRVEPREPRASRDPAMRTCAVTRFARKRGAGRRNRHRLHVMRLDDRDDAPEAKRGADPDEGP